MARLYSNENFPLPVVEGLRRAGHDVLTVLEAGNANQSVADVDVLAFAISLGRIVLTLNRRHFIRLHQERPQHFGIVVTTYDSNFEAHAQRIDAALRDHTDMTGQLVRVNRLLK